MAAYDEDLLRFLPKVLRARDFHLYLESGKRITDLWRMGGRMVLGHKPPRVLLELKNAAERGLFVPLPHPTERRFVKALEGFFTRRVFRLYMNENSMRQALEAAGLYGPFQDPAFPARDSLPNSTGKPGISLWRPFLDFSQQAAAQQAAALQDAAHCNAAVLIPVLPWPLGPAVLALEEGMDTSPIPAGELIPPVLLAPAARALYNLAAAMKTFSPNRPMYKKIEKALAKGPWRRRGIYLTVKPGMEGEAYKALFEKFLEGGFLIPPSPQQPVILPLSMTAGEESKLAGLLGSWIE